jgi:hypothetical protein
MVLITDSIAVSTKIYFKRILSGDDFIVEKTHVKQKYFIYPLKLSLLEICPSSTKNSYIFSLLKNNSLLLNSPINHIEYINIINQFKSFYFN